MSQKTIIHGHFYQTPLLRPETGLSASDGQDSYERITAECYCPNSASRILDGSGKIADILLNRRSLRAKLLPVFLRHSQLLIGVDNAPL